MDVRYGNISARCDRCGCAGFSLANPRERLTGTSAFECLSCGMISLHRDLLYQIGDEAARQSRSALRRIRLHRLRLVARRGAEWPGHER